MVTTRFRSARPADVHEIGRIRLAVRENQLSDPSRVPPELVRHYLRVRGCGWVCESGDRLVGFSIADLTTASVWALFVEPGCEGRGIGTKLLALAVDWLRAAGAGEITLSTEPSTRAEGFYRSRGWVPAGLSDNGDVRLVLPADSGPG